MTTPLLSIATANYGSPLWIELFIKSVRRFTTIEHELVVIDNGSGPGDLVWLRAQRDIRLIENPDNSGLSGGAMDQITELADGRYICFMDSDAHFQREGWENDVLALYHKDPQTRLVCKEGPISIGRPVHPPLFFYERDFFREHGLSFRYQKGVPHSTDVAQKVYWDILDLGYKVELFKRGDHIYGPAVAGIDGQLGGNEIWFGGKPTIYHHFYGSRLRHLGENKWRWEAYYRLGDEKEAVHEARTAALFREPLVKRILSEEGRHG